MIKKGVILFVDDEYYILQTLKAILRRDFTEHELLFAQNGEDALNLLGEHEALASKELLVFSDWLMPGLKGDELLVKVSAKFPKSKNFLLSGMINREPSEDIFQRARILKIVEKPWENDELIELIKEVLD